MKQNFYALILLGLTFFNVQASADSSSVESNAAVDSTILKQLEIEQSLKYQTGEITLGSNIAKLRVPKGFKFLDATQSKTVLTTLWGNPPDESTLGLLLPEDITPLSENFSYVVEISYSEEGHIEDDDAEDINYEDLLKEMQEDAKNGNTDRAAAGYPTMELVGWAAPPFYDADNKKLHWAKEIKFGDAKTNTLNYNIRVLGRKGVMVLNIISDIDKLNLVKPKVNTILGSVEFTEGNKYSDFNPDIDKVAAYGIGGLIAGKVLAKVGFFAVFAKLWKFILIGVVAGFAALKKFIFGKKKNESPAEEPGAEVMETTEEKKEQE